MFCFGFTIGVCAFFCDIIHRMNGVILFIKSYWDRMLVLVYVVFLFASFIIEPVRTVTTELKQYSFKECVGEWENAHAASQMPDILVDNYLDLEKIITSSTQWKSGLTSIECSGLSEQNDFKNVISGTIHVVGFVNNSVISEKSVLQIAAIDDLIENPNPLSTSTPLIIDPPEDLATSTAVTTSTASTNDTEQNQEDVPLISEQPAQEVADQSSVQVVLDPNKIDVQYLIDGNDWRSAGFITDFSQETFAFPINFEGVSDQNIGSLRIRLVGLSENNDQVFYIDSVWVSLESVIGEAVPSETEKNIEKIEPVLTSAKSETLSEKGPAPVFEGVVIENPAIIIPEPEKIEIDSTAKHLCEAGEYRINLDRFSTTNKSVDILVSGTENTSSTLHVVRIPEGLSFAFENGQDEIPLLGNQVSAKLTISIIQEIESRSFNIPIVYSVIRSDLAKSNSLCHLNVIVD